MSCKNEHSAFCMGSEIFSICNHNSWNKQKKEKKPHLRCFNYLAQSIILYFKFFAMKKNKETSVEGYVRFIRNKGSQYVTRIVAKKQATYAGRKCKAKYIWLFPCQI